MLYQIYEAEYCLKNIKLVSSFRTENVPSQSGGEGQGRLSYPRGTGGPNIL